MLRLCAVMLSLPLCLALQPFPAAYLVNSLWDFVPGRPYFLREVFPMLDTKNRMVRCYNLRHESNKWLVLDYATELSSAPPHSQASVNDGTIDAYDVEALTFDPYHTKLIRHMKKYFKYQQTPARMFLVVVTYFDDDTKKDV